MQWFNGNKTYLTGAVAVALGVGGLFGFDGIPGVADDPMTLIMGGIAAITMRAGIAKGPGK